MADTSLSSKRLGLLVWQVSNFWQNKLRNILKSYNLTLNEYLILLSIYEIQMPLGTLSQNKLSIFAGIDVSVVSVVLKLLESKKLIKRNIDKDNRKKTIEMLTTGKNLFFKLHPKIESEENLIFEKLQDEKIYFSNSLRLILGKKLRVKADNN